MVAYANDVDIVTKWKKELIKTFRKLELAACGCGLKVNETKTKCMATKKGGSQQASYLHFISQTQKYVFGKVEYLVTTVAAGNKENEELQKMMTKESKTT